MKPIPKELEFLEKLDWALNDDEKKTEFDCLDKARAMVDKRLKQLRGATNVHHPQRE